MKQLSYMVSVICLLVGCEQSQTVGGCDGEAVGMDGAPVNERDGSAGGEGGDGGGSALLHDGESCDDDGQCESAYCVPSKNSFGSGVCFSMAMVGCVVITDPSPFVAMCASVSKRLYACGDYDVSLLGTCADVGTGDAGEHYQCCNKPGFP